MKIDLADKSAVVSGSTAVWRAVPADRTKALRDAFMKANADPEYLAEAQKLNVDVSPLDGETMTFEFSIRRLPWERTGASLTMTILLPA